MIRSCEDFERWLDDGRPDDGKGAAEVHAASCGRCREALAAARSIEEALALPTATLAPAGFTDDVMRRVVAAEAESVAGQVGVRGVGNLVLWLGLVAEPWVAVPCLLVALMAWRGSALLAIAGKITSPLALWADAAARALPTLTIALPAALRALSTPGAMLGLGMAVAPVILWASWQLARWSERAFALPLVRPRAFDGRDPFR